MSALLFAVYVAFAGGHRVALASEDRLPKPDPQGYYRVMTSKDATSTSTCLGRNDLPVCSVETALACVSRGSDALCRAALADGAAVPAKAPEAGRDFRYRIDKVDVLGYPPHGFPHARVGDLTIRVSEVSGPARTYYVGKRHGAWRVYGWDAVPAAAH